MDFVEWLPTLNLFNSILVVVDHFSKYANLIPLKHPFTVEIVEKFATEIIKLHGMPKSIVFDWNGQFKLQGTPLRMGSSCHPQMDGQIVVICVRQPLVLVEVAILGRVFI